MISEKILALNEETYFYIYPKKSENPNSRKSKYTNVEPMNIKQMVGYDEYLELRGTIKARAERRIRILQMTNGLYGEDLKSAIELFNAQNPGKKFAKSTVAALKVQFKNYGLRGIFPRPHHDTKGKIPPEVYNTFKKYYLNKNKLSSEEALRLAQNELLNLHKIEYPLVYSAKGFINKLQKEMTKEAVAHFRETASYEGAGQIDTTVCESSDMLFSEAVKIYFLKLKTECLAEKLVQDKTSYQNHLSKYFDNLTIKEITPERIKDFKQRIYNTGYSVSSATHYVTLIREVIRTVCPQTSNFKKRAILVTSADMNILKETQIKEMLKLAKKKSLWGYTIMKIVLTTGASVPEALGLTWENLNITHQKIHVKQFLYIDRPIKHRMNSAYRELPVDKEVTKNLVEIYLQKLPEKEELIFSLDLTKNLQQYFEETVLTPISEQLSIKNFISSDLIHNFVHLLIEQNVPIAYIRKTCGYPSVKKFLEVYNKQYEEIEEDFYNPLENMSNSH